MHISTSTEIVVAEKYRSIKESRDRKDHASDKELSDVQSALNQAYESAKKYFAENLSKSESRLSWLEDCHSLQDFQNVVEEARKQYEAKPTSKAFNWLTVFSKRAKYYGTILDVLAQHHPEYVSLVWGAFKLIFGVHLPSP